MLIIGGKIENREKFENCEKKRKSWKKFKIRKKKFYIESWTLPIQLWSVMFHNLTDPSQDEDNAYSSLGCKATAKIGASWPANVTFLNVSVWIKVKVISALPAKTCLSMTSRQVASALNFVIVPSGSPLPSLKSKERLQFDDFFSSNFLRFDGNF